MPVETRKRKSTNDSARTNEAGDTTYAEPPKQRQPAKSAAGKGPTKKATTKVKTGKTATRGKAKKQDEDPQEDENDSGRNSSQTFLAEASKSKKRKVTAASSKEDIQEALEKFMGTFNGEPEKKSSANLADKLRQHLPSGLEEIMIYGGGFSSNSKGSPKCRPHDTARAVLHQISTNLRTYQSLSTSTPIKRPDWMEWEQDYKSLVELNDHALRVAARQVNPMIIPGGRLDEKPENDSDIAKLAWEIFESDRPVELENTWGRIAKEQVKMFMGILRGVAGV